ncbi:hypothetical protein HT031_002426 [Scenedesmus sp. PABB004]|nr:hypothetical protein HT031_002426 [Scenedesmus sp. PABB004]
MRRRARATPPAEADPADSYEDLLALDAHAVRRGVRPAALAVLPRRAPSAADAAAQRRCFICLERWAPPSSGGGAHQHQHHQQHQQHQQQDHGAIVALPCRHEFCLACCARWLAEHATCPTCRWAFPESATTLINFSAKKVRRAALATSGRRPRRLQTLCISNRPPSDPEQQCHAFQARARARTMCSSSRDRELPADRPQPHRGTGVFIRLRPSADEQPVGEAGAAVERSATSCPSFSPPLLGLPAAGDAPRRSAELPRPASAGGGPAAQLGWPGAGRAASHLARGCDSVTPGSPPSEEVCITASMWAPDAARGAGCVRSAQSAGDELGYFSLAPRQPRGGSPLGAGGWPAPRCAGGSPPPAGGALCATLDAQLAAAAAEGARARAPAARLASAYSCPAPLPAAPWGSAIADAAAPFWLSEQLPTWSLDQQVQALEEEEAEQLSMLLAIDGQLQRLLALRERLGAAAAPPPALPSASARHPFADAGAAGVAPLGGAGAVGGYLDVHGATALQHRMCMTAAAHRACEAAAPLDDELQHKLQELLAVQAAQMELQAELLQLLAAGQLPPGGGAHSI